MDSSWSAFQRFSTQIQGDFFKKTRKKKKKERKYNKINIGFCYMLFKEAFSVVDLSILKFKSSKLCKLT